MCVPSKSPRISVIVSLFVSDLHVCDIVYISMSVPGTGNRVLVFEAEAPVRAGTPDVKIRDSCVSRKFSNFCLKIAFLLINLKACALMILSV